MPRSIGPFCGAGWGLIAEVHLDPGSIVFCRTIFGVRLCWELEEPQGPEKTVQMRACPVVLKAHCLPKNEPGGRQRVNRKEFYRGTSRISNAHPPRTTIGPYA